MGIILFLFVHKQHQPEIDTKMTGSIFLKLTFIFVVIAVVFQTEEVSARGEKCKKQQDCVAYQEAGISIVAESLKSAGSVAEMQTVITGKNAKKSNVFQSDCVRITSDKKRPADVKQ